MEPSPQQREDSGNHNDNDFSAPRERANPHSAQDVYRNSNRVPMRVSTGSQYYFPGHEASHPRSMSFDGPEYAMPHQPLGLGTRSTFPDPQSGLFDGYVKPPLWTLNDPLYSELSPDDPWAQCKTAVDKYDDDLCQGWTSDVDNMLIFAGLFSAVVTAFCIEAYQLLTLAPENATSALLLVLVQQATGANITAPDIIQEGPKLVLDRRDLQINALYFVSLSLALIVASVCLLCKQWLREYRRDLSMSHVDAARLRQLRYNGLITWKIPEILGWLPIVLELALLLFSCGLLRQLWDTHLAVVIPVAVVTFAAGVFFLITSIAPACQILRIYPSSLSHQSKTFSELTGYIPFRSPQAWYSYLILKSIWTCASAFFHPFRLYFCHDVTSKTDSIDLPSTTHNETNTAPNHYASPNTLSGDSGQLAAAQPGVPEGTVTHSMPGASTSTGTGGQAPHTVLQMSDNDAHRLHDSTSPSIEMGHLKSWEDVDKVGIRSHNHASASVKEICAALGWASEYLGNSSEMHRSLLWCAERYRLDSETTINHTKTRPRNGSETPSNHPKNSLDQRSSGASTSLHAELSKLRKGLIAKVLGNHAFETVGDRSWKLGVELELKTLNTSMKSEPPLDFHKLASMATRTFGTLLRNFKFSAKKSLHADSLLTDDGYVRTMDQVALSIHFTIQRLFNGSASPQLPESLLLEFSQVVTALLASLLQITALTRHLAMFDIPKTVAEGLQKHSDINLALSLGRCLGEQFHLSTNLRISPLRISFFEVLNKFIVTVHSRLKQDQLQEWDMWRNQVVTDLGESNIRFGPNLHVPAIASVPQPEATPTATDGHPATTDGHSGPPNLTFPIPISSNAEGQTSSTADIHPNQHLLGTSIMPDLRQNIPPTEPLHRVNSE